MKKFKISEDVLATVISYLQSRPFKEVEQIMKVLPLDIELIGDEDVVRPFVPKEQTIPSFTEEKEEKPKKKSKKK